MIKVNVYACMFMNFQSGGRKVLSKNFHFTFQKLMVLLEAIEIKSLKLNY